jgi:uncharacterized protein YbjT (DUF2867 family)
MSKKVVLVGATGLVGKEMLSILQANDGVSEIICLLRRPVNLGIEKARGCVVDFMNLDESRGLFDGAAAVICCVGTTMKVAKTREQFQMVDHYIPKEVARLAKEAGIESYSLVSSLGANPLSRSFYLRVKGAIENELKKNGFHRLLIYRPSLLLGRRAKKRPGELAMALFFRCFFWGIPKKYHPTDAVVLAKLMAEHALGFENGVHIFESSVIK